MSRRRVTRQLLDGQPRLNCLLGPRGRVSWALPEGSTFSSRTGLAFLQRG